ncbi:MAG: hypothetical protein U9N57_11970, partial [Pseudomonadota bacterium]|nr:hypothetical protein [Pseudomonadota bacterium]
MKTKLKFIDSLPVLFQVLSKSPFLNSPDSTVTSSQRILIWAANYSAEIEKKLTNSYYQVYLLEDGFLRSVGLGINHARPLSLVVDSRGMYYDCTKESDLEHIL